jgi:membrane-associated progesterone receptor component
LILAAKKMDAIKEAVKEIGALDVILLALSCYIIWKLVISKLFAKPTPEEPRIPELPAMRRRDMTVEELREYDGVQRPDGRICIAVDGKIFDVTKGKRMYGKDGPYGIFAGRDASRGLATFVASSEAVKDTYDDLSDLTPTELEGMREWAAQFSEKYPVVGRLLKPGDVPETYSDEDDKSGSISGSESMTASTNSSNDESEKKQE